MPPLFPFSVFLTPAPEPFERLSRTIRDLAKRFDSPAFEPHVTVYGGRCSDPETLLPLLSAAVDGIPAFPLRVRGIEYTEEFFKSFFIRFEEHPLLRTIHDRVREGAETDSGYRLMPHLSLLYADLPAGVKEALVLDLQPGPEILFDEVRLVSPKDPEKGWLDTPGWRTIGRRKLDGDSGSFGSGRDKSSAQTAD
jgi:putative hydrolase of the HAD superfamily